jgi:sialidase-1
MSKRLNSQHGIVCRLPGERLGYFGWPGLARLNDGSLLVSSSGLRSEHVCPWGKTVLNASKDEGKTWSPPRVINDSPLDDRDTGLLHLGGGKLLITWFTADTRRDSFTDSIREWLGAEEMDSWKHTVNRWTEEDVQRWLGSWIMLSDDRGATWSQPLRSPVSSPAGPGLLASGDLLYLGKDASAMGDGRILAVRSRDGGCSWALSGTVPLYPGTVAGNYHEPHVVELPNGRLVGMIRVENHASCDLASVGVVNFSLMQTNSDDGGATWSVPCPLGFHGSPPHLLRHSSGTLVCVYGYRQAGFGQRAMLSYDDGQTWEQDWIIRDDGLDFDLGYPKSVEMNDGSIFTVYYQKLPGDKKCSLLWSRWTLPAVE